MREALARKLAWPFAWSSIALVVAALALSILALIAGGAGVKAAPHQVFNPIFTLTYCLVGALVASRHPRNPVGWISAGVGFLSAVSLGSMGYIMLSQSEAVRGTLPGVDLALWLGYWVWIPPTALPMTFLILLFPDGRLPSPRWRPVAWSAGGGLGAVVLVAAFHPGLQEQVGAPGPNPFAIQNAARPMDVLLNLALPMMLLAFLGSVAASVVRFRRARGIERQQLKWLAYAGSLMILGMVVSGVLYALWPGDAAASEVGIIVTGIAQVGIVVAAGIAILRYRLYDIDLIVHRTLVYGLLTGSVLLLYVALVSLLGMLLQMRTGLAGSLIATGVVAVVFQPLRERLQKGVSRLLFGQRDEPYAVLTGLSRRLQGTLQPEGALQTIVDTVAQALKLPYAAITLADGDRFRVVSAHGRPAGETLSLPLIYQGETVGQLIVSPRSPNEDFQRSERNLLEEIAQQAGVVVHGVRLMADLQRSRERLVTAREEERRSLRRELHDGLGPELAGLALKLSAARNLISSDPRYADKLIDELTGQFQETLAGIRRLAYELRPPALDELGLVPAVRESASSQTAGGPRIVVEASRPLPTLPAAVEVAAYRIATEAVTNVARHASAENAIVRFDLSDALEVTIEDDGVGMPATARAGVGITSMRERAAELGGRLEVESVPGGGTRVHARLPILSVEG